MDINIVPTVLQQFLTYVEPLVGKVVLTITDPLDAARFPDECSKLGGGSAGVYLIWGKFDARILYVGISNDIRSRINQHIGTGYSWERDGGTAAFPNCTLAAGRNWLSPQAQDVLRRAQFNVTAIFPDPPEISSLLESFLVFYGHQHGGKPEINVEF